MRSLILVVALITLGGCLKSERQELIEKAESAVRYNMRDPDATQFRDVNVCLDDTAMVHGWYNAKNGYGAYTGFNAFYYDSKSFDLITSESAGHSISKFREMMIRCFGPLDEPGSLEGEDPQAKSEGYDQQKRPCRVGACAPLP